MSKTAQYGQWQPGGMFAVADAAQHTTGSIFWVHSGTGTDSVGFGRDPSTPVATIDYAVGLCAADKGDVIYVMQGHNEGLGNAQIDIDVAGVSVIGLGRGSQRPRIDFDHASASIDIGANGVTLKNITLLPSITDVLIAIDVEAAKTDVTIEDVEALPGEDGAGVDDFAAVVEFKAGCTRGVVRRLKVRQHATAAGYIAGVRLKGASDDVLIEDSDFVMAGAALVAPINGDTTLSTNLRVRRCVMQTDAEPGIEVLTNTTGIVEDCRIASDLASLAAAIAGNGGAHALYLFNNYNCEVVTETGGLIGTASVDD
jgi:hypothetical protein